MSISEKITSGLVTLKFEDGIDYTIEIYQDGIAKDQFRDLVMKIPKNLKKSKFGKNYFKK